MSIRTALKFVLPAALSALVLFLAVQLLSPLFRPTRNYSEIRNEQVTVKYDPSLCRKTADGMIYITLGTTTLKLPADAPIIVSELQAPQDVPQPSSQVSVGPPGCPGNPIPARNISFAYHYKALLTEKRMPSDLKGKPSGEPSQLRIVSVTPDYWGMQAWAEKRFLDVCEKYNIRLIGDQMEVCRNSKVNPAAPEDHSEAIYRALPEVYGTPYGRPFVVLCNFSVSLRECHVRYKFRETVNISYRFYERDLPVTRVIEFDKGLRESLESAIVSEGLSK